LLINGLLFQNYEVLNVAVLPTNIVKGKEELKKKKKKKKKKKMKKKKKKKKNRQRRKKRMKNNWFGLYVDYL